MTLPLNVSRCPGRWEPNEKTYLKNECTTCLRYLERHVTGAYQFLKAPVELGQNCVFYRPERTDVQDDPRT